MDHPIILTWGLLPDKIWAYRGPGSTSGIPSFRDGKFRSQHSAFRVEIGNWGWSFPANAPYSTFEDLLAGHDDGYSVVNPIWGKALRKKLADVLPRQFRMAWEFEQIPEATNYITIDDNYKDQLGNHRPVIHYNLPEYVRAAMKVARDTSHTLYKNLKLEPLYEKDDVGKPRDNPVGYRPGKDYTHYDSSKPGYIVYGDQGYAFEGAGHVAGTHRMGFTKEDSVVNKHQQSWDHPNLFMVGCGNMPTIGTSNPTLTITALAIQAGENINKYLEGKSL
jgi:choline dehydrogenase-like flavoprotein